MKKERTMQRGLISFFAMIVSVLLLALNFVGDFLPAQAKDLDSKYNLPGYSYALLSPSEAKSKLASLETLEPTDRLLRLSQLIFESYVHRTRGAYQRRPWDNWYLYLRALWNPRFLSSQDGEFLWSKGGGYCDQAATIFVDYATRLGFEVRIAWLTGHVVAEVFIPELGWASF